MYSLNLGSKLVQNMGPSTFTETLESQRLLKICVNLSILVKPILFQGRELKCLPSWMFDLTTDLAHFGVRVVNPISIFRTQNFYMYIKGTTIKVDHSYWVSKALGVDY